LPGQERDGGVFSLMAIVKMHDELRLALSNEMQPSVLTPMGNGEPIAGEQVRLRIPDPSVGVGSV
jgi:hypothetical protein